jgi:pimeloyl-ACP methyl ester carboxylesterase
VAAPSPSDGFTAEGAKAMASAQAATPTGSKALFSFGNAYALMPDLKLNDVVLQDNEAVLQLSDGAFTCLLKTQGDEILFDYPAITDAWEPITRDTDRFILKNLLLTGPVVETLQKTLIQQGRSADAAKLESLAASLLRQLPKNPVTEEGRPGLPLRERYILSGDVHLFVREVGGGNPNAKVLVCIHGGPDCDSSPMRPIEMLASPDLKVVTYDQRGSGRSTRPDPQDYQLINGQASYDWSKPEMHDAFSMKAHLGDLQAVIDAVTADQKNKSVILAPLSFGGMIAMQRLASPNGLNHIAGVAFMDCVPPTSAEYNEGQANATNLTKVRQAQGLMPPDAQWPSPTPWNDNTPGIAAELPLYFVDPQRISPQAHCTLRNEDNDPNFGTAAAANNYDLTQPLAQVAGKLPVMVSAGREDPFGSVWPEALGKTLDVTPVIIDHAGHAPWLEGRDAVAEWRTAMTNFIKTCGPAPTEGASTGPRA